MDTGQLISSQIWALLGLVLKPSLFHLQLFRKKRIDIHGIQDHVTPLVTNSYVFSTLCSLDQSFFGRLWALGS